MSLRRFYGFTGQISAKRLGNILFIVNVLAYTWLVICYAFVGIRNALIKFHIIKKDLPKEETEHIPTYEEWLQEIDEALAKEEIKKRRHKHGKRN